MDFSQEDLFDAIDRLVASLLERAGVDRPPVDSLDVAENHIGIPVEVVEPEEDERGRPRPSSRRHTAGIVLSPHMTPEQQQTAAANGVARTLLPDLLRKLDIVPGSESKQAAAHFRSLIAARLLVPTKMFRAALRECKYDVPALKGVFKTATFEACGFRLLDLDQPCVVSVIDDGIVAVRRGNQTQPGKKLVPAEQRCMEETMRLELPRRVRLDGWTVQGWFVPNRPFRRVLLHAFPDDV
jgi:predicted transcriptional regulator